MQTSSLGLLSTHLLQVSSNSSNSSNSNRYEGLGHQQSSLGKHLMASRKYTRAWARPNRALPVRLLKVLFHKRQAVLVIYRRRPPAV